MNWIVLVVFFVFLTNCFNPGDAELICISESWRANSIRCKPTGGLFNTLEKTIPVYGIKGGGKVNALYFKNCKIMNLSPQGFANFPDTQVLDLSLNFIPKLADDVFNGLANLQALNISYNLIESINSEVFKPLTKMRDLDLSSNLLTINSGDSIFKGLTALRGLDLSNNVEVSILPDLLLGLNLRTLSISKNRLQFPDTYLLDQPNLSYLDLSENERLFDTGYLGTVLQACVNLIHLKISNSNLETIESNSLKENARLRILNLSANKLVKLMNDQFFRNIVLMDVDLSKNQIETLPNKLFQRNVEIIALNLSNNKIKRLLSNSFEMLTKLQVLDMRGNHITTLPNGLFIKNGALRTLDLTNNQLKNLNEFTFAKNAEIRFLHLGNNLIESFNYDVVANMNNLYHLDLDNNRLTTISFDILNMLSIYDLWISCNNIVSLPETLFSEVQRGQKVIRLHGNPWNCGCLNLLLKYKNVTIDYQYIGFADGNSMSCIVGGNPSICNNAVSADDLKMWLETHRLYSNPCISKLN